MRKRKPRMTVRSCKKTLSGLSLLSDPALFVWNSREMEDPLGNGVTPHDGFSALILQTRENVVVPRLVDMPGERFPLRHEFSRAVGAFVMRVVNVLYDRFPRMQDVGVRDVVKKQQQVVRAGSKRFVLLLHLRRILPDESGAARYRTAHADPSV